MPVNPAMVTLAREARELKQADLAKALGYSTSTICRIEIGELSADRDVSAIANALEFEPEFFEQRQPVLALAGDFLYRRRAYVSATTKRRVQAECNIIAMQVGRLLAASEIDDSGAPLPTFVPDEHHD